MGDLRTTYDVHFGLTGKRVVDFLLVLIELFLLGVTATLVENKSKIGFLKAGGSVCAKFSRIRERLPPIIFPRIVRPMNALQLCP